MTGRPAADLTTPRRLCGNGCLEGQAREQRRLDQLGLHGRRRHANEGLVGEDRRALADGPDVAGEVKTREILIEEPRRHALKIRQSAEVLDLFGLETQLLEVAERLLEPCGDKERPVGAATHERTARRWRARPPPRRSSPPSWSARRGQWKGRSGSWCLVPGSWCLAAVASWMLCQTTSSPLCSWWTCRMTSAPAAPSRSADGRSRRRPAQPDDCPCGGAADRSMPPVIGIPPGPSISRPTAAPGRPTASRARAARASIPISSFPRMCTS